MNHTVFYANNRKISLYIWENQNYFRPLAIIQIVHGFFDHASRYDEFAQFLVRHNFVVVAHDLNGHGYTSSIPSNHEVPSLNISSISSPSPPLYSKTYNKPVVVNENTYSQIHYPQGYELKENKKKFKAPANIQNYTTSSKLSNDNLKEKYEIKKTPTSINSSSEIVGISTIPKASPVNPKDELDITPEYQSSDSKIDNYNSNYAKDKNNDDELPLYSSSFSHLGYEDGNMFENDVADIIAISSYCRERFLHLPLILLGVGYGSLLVQYFIEHNKYRLNNRKENWEREDSSSYDNRDHYYHHCNNHRYHQKKKHQHQQSSKHNKNKYKKDVHDDSSLIQRHYLIDPTINGFILCGTNYMKGLILRTNAVYANLLYYIKGKNYRTNFLFPSIFQTYKLQTESELLNSDSDSDSDSDSISDSDSYIESPRPGESSKERISVPIVTFSSSEIQKDKPLNQWFTRNFYELTKAQRDPLCNFSYSTNFYRSLLNATDKLYKKSSGKAINTKIPILIIAGDHDPLGNYSKGPVKLYNFYKDYKVNNVKLFIYENARHSVLFENNKVEIYHDILKWTNDNILIGY